MNLSIKKKRFINYKFRKLLRAYLKCWEFRFLNCVTGGFAAECLVDFENCLLQKNRNECFFYIYIIFYNFK